MRNSLVVLADSEEGMVSDVSKTDVSLYDFSTKNVY